MPKRIEFPSYKKRMDEVRRELEARGITQMELGAKAGIPHWQIGRLLNGTLPEDIEDLRRFCEAVGRPLGLFLLEDPEIDALLKFHGNGPSRGKGSRRQGRRTAGSLLLALSVGGAGLLGLPSGARAAAPQLPLNIIRPAETFSFVSRVYEVLLIRRWHAAFRRWLATPVHSLALAA